MTHTFEFGYRQILEVEDFSDFECIGELKSGVCDAKMSLKINNK